VCNLIDQPFPREVSAAQRFGLIFTSVDGLRRKCRQADGNVLGSFIVRCAVSNTDACASDNRLPAADF
jgi:hypothetical protein